MLNFCFDYYMDLHKVLLYCTVSEHVCMCLMTQGMDQRQRPLLLCWNQWDWILKVFSGASAPLVNTVLCHKCILYTQMHTHTRTHTLPVPFTQARPPTPSSSQYTSKYICCCPSPQLNLAPFSPFHIPYFSTSPHISTSTFSYLPFVASFSSLDVCMTPSLLSSAMCIAYLHEV